MTLRYFDMPGKAQAIRFALALGKRAFRDVRLTVDEYYAEQAAGSLPFGSLPVLDVTTCDGETRLAQSDAILRLAGSVSGLAPSDPILQARIDQYVALENDFSYPFTLALFPDKCYLPAWPAGARSHPPARVHTATTEPRKGPLRAPEPARRTSDRPTAVSVRCGTCRGCGHLPTRHWHAPRAHLFALREGRPRALLHWLARRHARPVHS